MQPNTITKSVAYAYPTSPSAVKLGHAETGCYYVQQTRHNIEGSGRAKTYIAHNCEGFAAPDDPELIALFHEYEGTICPHFLKHGDKRAITAITQPLHKEELMITSLQVTLTSLKAVETRLQELDALPEHTAKEHRELEALEYRRHELLRDLAAIKRNEEV